MPLAATVLEEYGLPFQVTMRIEERASLGESVDEILAKLRKVDFTEINLTDFEREMIDDTISNL
jgi:hypothetical protein